MSAVISDCGKYRYTLEREWMTGAGTCLFVMLNPSTADASENDPTIRRCIKFAQRWGYQRLAVGNLYAWRSPHPGKLPAGLPAVGPENDVWLRRLCTKAALIVAAWGTHPIATCRTAQVGEILAEWRGGVVCLGTTADGSPKHPLARGRHRVPDDFEPLPFTPLSEAA